MFYKLLFKLFTLFRKPDETWFTGNNLRVFSYVTTPIIYRADEVLKEDKKYFIEHYFYRFKSYKVVNFLVKFKFEFNGIPVSFKHFQ